MVRQFTGLVKRNMKLRAEVERELSFTLRDFSVARSVTPVYRAEAAFSLPVSSVTAECETGCIMGVDIPKITVKGKAGKGLPYAYPEMRARRTRQSERQGNFFPNSSSLPRSKRRCACLPPKSSGTNGG